MIFRVLALGFFAGSLPTLNAQTPATARASLLEADRATGAAVFQRGIQVGLNDVLSEDAILVFEGAPIVAGRGRIIQVLASQPSLSRLRVQRMPVLAFTSTDGTYGTTSGASIITHKGQALDSAATFGHYIAVWRRPGEAAPWRIVALVENGLLGDATFQPPSGLQPGSVPPFAGTARLLADADVAFARMAADSGVGAAFGHFAAADATFPPPGESDMTVGASAIRARMSTPSRRQAVWVWHPVFAGASAAGDFGFTVGESTIRSSPAADASVYEGKYLTVWQRQADGSIKYILDSGNSR